MHNPAPAGTSTVTAALEPPPPLPPPQDGSSKPPPTPRLSHNGKTDLPDCPLYVSTRRCPKDHRNCPLNHPVLPKLKKKNKYHGPATREVPNRVCNCILYGKVCPYGDKCKFLHTMPTSDQPVQTAQSHVNTMAAQQQQQQQQ